MTAVFHVRSYGRFIETKSNFGRKKLHKMNHGTNFSGGSFSNEDNARAPIQFTKERQSYDLDRSNENKLSFSRTEMNKPLPTPV